MLPNFWPPEAKAKDPGPALLQPLLAAQWPQLMADFLLPCEAEGGSMGCQAVWGCF